MPGESEKDRKQTARRFIDAIWGRLTSESLDSILDPEYVGHEAGNPRVLDRRALRQLAEGYKEAFHNMEARVENVILDDGHGALLWWADGHHRGRFMGVEPTNREVLITGMALLRFRHGRIVESWLNWDRLEVMHQLGAAPQVPSAPAGR